jgi:hypothetical protein|tara:strand:- start:169 stop:444 length:276 start_codon:yes stop_codon:yes gene_type:complete
MATDIKSRADGVDMTRFWGGDDKGTCVQVSMRRDSVKNPVTTADQFFTSVSLTREQAKQVAADLLAFAEGKEVEDDGEVPQWAWTCKKEED